jgi:hypothetical protein
MVYHMEMVGPNGIEWGKPMPKKAWMTPFQYEALLTWLYRFEPTWIPGLGREPYRLFGVELRTLDPRDMNLVPAR